MPDETTVATVAEATPPPPPPQADELFTTSNAASESRGSEKIGGILDRVAAKFKVGRGRPKKDGSPKISDRVITSDGKAIPASEQPALAVAVRADSPPSASDALLHRCIIGAAKGAFGALEDYTRRLGGQAGLDAAFVEKTLATARPSPETLADNSEAARLVLEKYNVKTQYAPEVALLMTTGRIVAPFWAAISLFKAEIKRKIEAEKKGATVCN